MLLHTIETQLRALSFEEKTPFHLGFHFLQIIKVHFGQESQRKVLSTRGEISDVSSGLILRKWFHYAPSLAGELEDVLTRLENSFSTKKYKTRFLMTFDGDTVLAKDTKLGDTLTCSFSELPSKAVFFSPLYGKERYIPAVETSVDKQATIQLGRIYDALTQADPVWAKNNTHDLNTFMTRLIFCLFAEDSNIFPKNLLTQTLSERGGEQGEGVHAVLKDIFSILNTPRHQRHNAPHWIKDFPYVNGDVFAINGIKIPKFSPLAYQQFKAAAKINWSNVNADILGASIQKIVDTNTRADLGMHYTSVANIHKLIDPLFVNEIKDKVLQASRMRNPTPALENILLRLYRVKLFDPACGSGNVLVIAYQSLRLLEMSIVKQLQKNTGYVLPDMSGISLSQFYGIEFADFAAETAKVALRIVEHQMDKKYADTFATPAPKLPLRDAPCVHTGSALSCDWVALCKANSDDEVFIIGNPPYLGAGERSKSQSAEQEKVFSRFTSPSQKLDYISCWFWLSKLFHEQVPNTRIGLVSTSSINQGMHLSHFWPEMLKGDLRINFAHLPFAWGNLASKNAQVTCVIIGLSSQQGDGTLFDGDTIKTCNEISPYLNGRNDVTVQSRKSPINGTMPRASFGCQPNDNGHLFITESDFNTLNDQGLGQYIRVFYGSKESTQGGHRYTLWLPDVAAQNIPKALLPFTEKCRLYRENSKRKATSTLSITPHRYAYIPKTFNPDAELNILIPRHSSSKRNYLPVKPLFDGEIIGDSAIMISDAKLWHFALLSSRLHCLWLATVGGRIKSDYRYASTLVWNTFPTPLLSAHQEQQLNQCAKTIIQAREEFGSDMRLGDMYNPSGMPVELKAAHDANDAVVEAIFSATSLSSDDDRLTALFSLYTHANQ
jgi:hypothetical protein